MRWHQSNSLRRYKPKSRLYAFEALPGAIAEIMADAYYAPEGLLRSRYDIKFPEAAAMVKGYKANVLPPPKPLPLPTDDLYTLEHLATQMCIAIAAIQRDPWYTIRDKRSEAIISRAQALADEIKTLAGIPRLEHEDYY